MKTTPKRMRSDSATAALQAAKNAALPPLKPPAHVSLRDTDRPFWNAIVTARARDTWNDSDLATAAIMARSQADIERLQAQVDIEGDTIVSASSGALVIHPAHKLIETLTRRVASLARMLHVHAEATVGRAADGVKALENEKAAKTEYDDLIPTLRAVK